MKLKQRALHQRAKRDILQDPAIEQPVGHDSIQEERRGDRRAFKVFALAGSVLGQHGNGNVEASQSRQAAQDEKSEADGVEGGTHAHCKGDHGGGDAKRNLQKNEKERLLVV